MILTSAACAARQPLALGLSRQPICSHPFVQIMIMAARLVVVAIAAQAVELDEMWLRRSLVADAALRARYAAQMGSVQVVGDAATVGDAASLAQLRTAAEERSSRSTS